MSRTHSATEFIAAPALALYRIVSDVTRTGEWSPTCRACEWEDPARTGVGASFIGHNETPARSWTSRSTVVTADPGRAFAWEVGKGWVRWSYTLTETGDGVTELTHAWEFTDAGLQHFVDKYGAAGADEWIRQRTESAHADMPRTLAAIREIAEREAAESETA